MSRPETLNDEMKQDVCKYLRLGASRRTIAQLLMIDESTIRKAAERDPEFDDAMQKAVAQLECDCLRSIARGKKHWRSSAWLLQHKFRDEYARKVVQKLRTLPTGPNDYQYDDTPDGRLYRHMLEISPPLPGEPKVINWPQIKSDAPDLPLENDSADPFNRPPEEPTQ
jgi:hypothetical protein